MLLSLKDQCVSNPKLCSRIKYLAKKLRGWYPSYLDLSDAENDLWLKLFDAIETKYDGSIPIIDYAFDVVFSSYGHLLVKNVEACTNPKKESKTNSISYLDEVHCNGGLVDTCYVDVETNYTLDQIESDLKLRYEKSKSMYFDFVTFRYLRQGKTDKQFCSDYLVTRSTWAKHKAKVLRFARKYA